MDDIRRRRRRRRRTMQAASEEIGLIIKCNEKKWRRRRGAFKYSALAIDIA